MTTSDSVLGAQFTRWQTRALIIGIVAAIASILGAIPNHAQFFHSYLFAWLFWSGLSFGALVIVMMQFVTGGLWGIAVRGLSIAAFRTLPIMALLFLPILFGIHDIFGWANGARAEAVGYHHKAQYLNIPFFTARTIIYFLVLIAFAFALRKRSDERTGHTVALSAGGLIVYVLCMNFASTDWVMSLDPEWYSTVFVEVFAAGQFLGALALMTALLVKFSHFSLEDSAATKAFHDLGNMLLTFVIFWSYVAFAQLLIIWSGNLPKEISWYLERSRGGWQWLALVLAILQFLLPFFLLLSRAAKRDRTRLASICWLILFASVINNFWLVAPSFHPAGFYLHWLDFVELIAIGGFWFASFFYFLKKRPLWPNGNLAEVQNA
jgi:hypothetical protein